MQDIPPFIGGFSKWFLPHWGQYIIHNVQSQEKLWGFGTLQMLYSEDLTGPSVSTDLLDYYPAHLLPFQSSCPVPRLSSGGLDNNVQEKLAVEYLSSDSEFSSTSSEGEGDGSDGST